ncbi:E3 ubiquitin-protein ligase CCNB1IP1-like isoform X2 [Ptychodera flava]|uniref:E3 ubiquitin-protein ligase CCNB1IP1-like isoform X2 n=1 Tax=Ptychodera flava TaxID=63121 RepID=UPI003969CC14
MDDLMCNYKKCRKHLSTFSWVTSCSHVFCDEDGTREFNKSYSCPACETSLSGKFDIVRIDMNPSEQYKSMVLAGQRPEVIMEIASRALAFWAYQNHQERTYQEYMANKNKERNTQLEQYYEQILSRAQAEVKALKGQIAALKKELETSKKRHGEISEKLMEKHRQHQKLQTMYDALRRRSITSTSFDVTGNVPVKHTPHGSFDIPITTGESVLGQPLKGKSSSHHSPSATPTRPDHFLFRPSSSIHNTPDMSSGGESVQRLMSVQDRFNMEMGTPNYLTRQLTGKKQ